MLSLFFKTIISYLSKPAKALVIFLCVILPAQALFVSPPKDPMPLIKDIFPQYTKISEKISAIEEAPLIWTIYGNTSDKNTIQTYVKVSGLQSGAVQEFTINITRVTST